MQKAERILNEFRSLELVCDSKSLYPAFRLLLGILFILFIISTPIYKPEYLLIWGIYPLWSAIHARLSLRIIARDLFLLSPFIFLLAMTNIFLNRDIALTFYKINISYGILSFFSLILKSFLSVSTLIILIRSHGFLPLLRSLEQLHFPAILRDLLLLLYRYIGLILEESIKIRNARQLRGSSKRKFTLTEASQILGQLFIRTWLRADKIYEAMLIRHYNGHLLLPDEKKIATSDIITITIWVILFTFMHYYPVTEFIGHQI